MCADAGCLPILQISTRKTWNMLYGGERLRQLLCFDVDHMSARQFRYPTGILFPGRRQQLLVSKFAY